jgi:Uma2 family endonuclease
LCVTKKAFTFDKNSLKMSVAVATIPDVAILSDYEKERGKPMPDKNHAIIQSRIVTKLSVKYEDNYTVLTEINLDLPVRERVPDLAIYPILDFQPDDNEMSMVVPPLGAIEILSEAQSPRELLKKRTEYFIGGVKSYWIVLPAFRTIYVYSSPDEYEIFKHTQILEDKILDIELDLKDIFK